MDPVAHAAGAQLRVEQPIGLLVLGQGQQTRVRLVVQRHPERAEDASVLEQVGEDVGEARHVLHRERERAPLPRDLDRRIRAVRELHRPDERGHPVGERPLAVVEEHPDVPRPERHHLGLQTREIRRRRRSMSANTCWLNCPPKPPKLLTRPRSRASLNSGGAVAVSAPSAGPGAAMTARPAAIAQPSVGTRATPKRRIPGRHPTTHGPFTVTAAKGDPVTADTDESTPGYGRYRREHAGTHPYPPERRREVGNAAPSNRRVTV